MNTTQELHDIKALPEFHPIPWQWLLACTLLILFAVFIFRLIKKHRQSSKYLAPVRVVPPLEEALKRLDDLSSRRNTQGLTPRDFSSGLSLIFRGYLELTLDFPATDLTTAEIHLRLAGFFSSLRFSFQEDKAKEMTEHAKKFLAQLDRITFSDQTDSTLSIRSQSMDIALETARELLMQVDAGTRPKDLDNAL